MFTCVVDKSPFSKGGFVRIIQIPLAPLYTRGENTGF